MFNINFLNLINYLVPNALRKSRMIVWLRLILSQIELVYGRFLNFRNKKLYDINFTGQVHYMERKLNETFHCTGIYIEDIDYIPQVFLFNRRENYLPNYFGNNWKRDRQYLAGDYVVYGIYWYEYIGTSSGTTPDLDENAVRKDRILMFMCNKDDPSYNNDFIVYVPMDVYNAFDDTDVVKLKEIVNYYKLAEMRFVIQTY